MQLGGEQRVVRGSVTLEHNTATQPGLEPKGQHTKLWVTMPPTINNKLKFNLFSM